MVNAITVIPTYLYLRSPTFAHFLGSQIYALLLHVNDDDDDYHLRRGEVKVKQSR
jgi:hypothetical protein